MIRYKKYQSKGVKYGKWYARAAATPTPAAESSIARAAKRLATVTTRHLASVMWHFTDATRHFAHGNGTQGKPGKTRGGVFQKGERPSKPRPNLVARAGRFPGLWGCGASEYPWERKDKKI